jgi:hypothetical protein
MPPAGWEANGTQPTELILRTLELSGHINREAIDVAA